jgi:hypothetical protein
MKPIKYQDYKDINNIDLAMTLQAKINDKVAQLKKL